jgi:hypothetical protein
VKDLYNKHYKTLKKEIKDGKASHVLGFGTMNIVKMSPGSGGSRL